MSHKGKMRRGEKYHNMRDMDGNYPKWITDSKSMKEDLDYFLNETKPKEVKKEKK